MFIFKCNYKQFLHCCGRTWTSHLLTLAQEISIRQDMALWEVVWPPGLSAEGTPLPCDTLHCKQCFNSHLDGLKETLQINKCTQACLGYLKGIKVSIQALGHHNLQSMMNFGVTGSTVTRNSRDITNIFRKVTKNLGLVCFSFLLVAPSPLYQTHRRSGNRPLLLEGQRRKKEYQKKTMGRCNTCTAIRWGSH